MSHEQLQEKFRQFARARDWEQFHTPKNIAIALSVEAAELMEHFQWLTDVQSQAIMNKAESAQEVTDELADVFLYLLRLADLLNVDLEQAALQKMQRNAEKYPVHLAKGNATKYTKLKKE